MKSLIDLLDLSGSAGPLTFVHTKNGTYVRKKRKPIADKFRTHPNYAPAREQSARFATASKAARIIRNAFHPWLKNGFSGQVHSRLVSLLLKMQKYAPDPKSDRTVAGCDLSLLKDFQFNEDTHLAAHICVPFTKEYDRPTGRLKIWMPEFDPHWHIRMPETATHFRVIVAAALVDLEALQTHSEYTRSAHHPANRIFSQRSLDIQLPPGATLPCLIALGLEFTQQVNGTHHPLMDKTTTPYAIIKIDQ